MAHDPDTRANVKRKDCERRVLLIFRQLLGEVIDMNTNLLIDADEQLRAFRSGAEPHDALIRFARAATNELLLDKRLHDFGTEGRCDVESICDLANTDLVRPRAIDLDERLMLQRLQAVRLGAYVDQAEDLPDDVPRFSNRLKIGFGCIVGIRQR